MDTLTHHQTIKKNISIMTEPVDMTIQSITCSVEKSTQTMVNEVSRMNWLLLIDQWYICLII